MSALGQKQTFAVQNVMSALPPITDIRRHDRHVRSVPKRADKRPNPSEPEIIPTPRMRAFVDTPSTERVYMLLASPKNKTK